MIGGDSLRHLDMFQEDTLLHQSTCPLEAIKSAWGSTSMEPSSRIAYQLKNHGTALMLLGLLFKNTLMGLVAQLGKKMTVHRKSHQKSHQRSHQRSHQKSHQKSRQRKMQ